MADSNNDGHDSTSSDSEIDEVVDHSVSVNMASKYDLSSSGLKYSGSPSDDLDSFISRFKNHSSLKDFTDSKAVLALLSVIVGHARVYLDSVGEADKDTVDKIHKLLKDQFEGPSWLWSVESQLLSRKQLSNESLDDYASDIMLWGRQTKKSDSELKSIFVRGLLPYIRGFVFSKQPESLRAALDAARLAISVQRTTEEQPLTEQSHKNTSQIQISHVDSTSSALENLTSLVSNISARLESVESNMNHRSRNSPNSYHRNSRPTRSVVCYRCGYTGHKWMNCFAKKGIDGRPLN